MDSIRLHNQIYMEEPKDYNIEIIHKDNTLQSTDYIRNYPTVYEKQVTLTADQLLTQKHANLYLNDGSLREITIIPESAIRIGQIQICHQQSYEDIVNTKTHHQQQQVEYLNRTDIPGDETKPFSYLNSKDQQHNIEYVSFTSAMYDNKLLSTFPREYDMVQPHCVTLDRQQRLLQQNLILQPVTHFQQQKPLIDNALIYDIKQYKVDYSHNETNLFQSKQIDNSDNIIGNTTFTAEKKVLEDSTKSNHNYGNDLINNKVDTVSFETDSNNYKTLTDNGYTAPSTENVDNSKVSKKNNKQYRCIICNALFATVALRNKHKKDVHQCNNVNKGVKKVKTVKTYSCSECSFVTKYSSALKRHKEVHTSNRQFECPTCGKVYNQLFNLKTHQRIHAGQKVYQCEQCDFITPYHYSLKRHKIFHTGEKAFTCFVCDKKFSAAPDLKRHLRSHTGQKPYFCDLCGRLFRQTGHLKFHRKKHHPEYVEDKSKTKPVFKIRINLPNPLLNSSKTNDATNIMKIKQSNVSVNISEVLEKAKIDLISITNPNKVKLETCEISQNNTTIATNPQSNNSGLNKVVVKQNLEDNIDKIVTYIRPFTGADLRKKTFHCEICDQTFKLSRDLKVHNKIHQGKKFFKCELCNFVTLHPSSLRKHKNSHTVKKIPCTQCDVSFKTEERLNVHMKIHDSNKKYNCDQCEFVSSYVSALNRHKLTHNVEKPFGCDICDENFSQECHLNTHKRLHSGMKVYKCDQCSFITPYNYSLKRHKISHTGIRPFRCTFCDAAFAGAEDLRRHIRAHLGEKPYICNICGRAFSQAAHVKNHKKKHFINPELKKIKKCLECGETFADLTLLRHHKRLNHKLNKSLPNMSHVENNLIDQT